MSEQEVREAVLRAIARIAPEVDPDSLDPREPLQRALDIDSFDFLNLLVAVRDETGVTVSQADYDEVRSLDEMVRFLDSRISRENPENDRGAGSTSSGSGS